MNTTPWRRIGEVDIQAFLDPLNIPENMSHLEQATVSMYDKSLCSHKSPVWRVWFQSYAENALCWPFNNGLKIYVIIWSWYILSNVLYVVHYEAVGLLVERKSLQIYCNYKGLCGLPSSASGPGPAAGSCDQVTCALLFHHRRRLPDCVTEQNH
jgi:hypothetical protein